MIVGQRDADELGGPLRIAQMSGDFAKVGLVTLIWFTALLSINLGLLNLFPVPMLDGGHLMFYAIEAVRGDRKSVVSGKSVSIRVDLGGRRILKKKKTQYK